MNHWSLEYLGKPWTVDGMGPDAFNCWGLCVWIQKHHFNRECPTYDLCNPRDTTLVAHKMETAASSPKWMRLKKATHGCIVAMGHSKHIHHVGIYLDVDGGMVLHSQSGKDEKLNRRGVQAQPFHSLVSHGWRRIEFYIHRTWLPQS